MNKIAYVFITVLLLLSCDNDDATQNLLNGKWNWVSSSGGIVGKTMTPASENKKIVLEFYSVMTKYENGNLVSEDAFSVETRESILGGQRKMIIIDNSEAQSFEIIGDKLFLSDECYDCYQYEYDRVK